MGTLDLSPAARQGRDPGLWLWTLSRRCWVRCTDCERAALVERTGPGWRLSCLHCGQSDLIKGQHKARALGGPGRNRQLRCVACGRNFGGAPWRGRLVSGKVRKSMKCRGCGREADYVLDCIAPDQANGVDPAFGLPLYLTTNVGGHSLWAVNPEHVRHLSDYLGSGLRKRTLQPHYMTMMARLPRWMKLAANRNRVLEGLRRLSALADGLE